ncbi:MAG: nitroreductase [Bacteroidetes bacterium]|nr:MAG: nitroreductase [Bacteroidota bacterium]
MEKPAKTNFEIQPLLKKRWSPRSFTDQPVSKETLQRIFEAARWTPSSSNDQPWRFIVGQKGDKTWDMIMETLVDFNKKWAKLAPVLALSIGKKISDKNGRPSKTFMYDVGQSVAHITFQVMQEGLFIHQMGGLDTHKAAEIFGVPDEYQVITAFAIGYKGEPNLLQDDFADMEKSERKRKPIENLVFEEEFGKTSAIFD